MTGSDDDDFVTGNEFKRRMKALERRLTKCEEMQNNILDQLNKLTSRSGEGSPIEAYANPDSDHHIIAIVEDLETDEEGAHMKGIKQVASEEGLLRWEAKNKVQQFVKEGYLFESEENRFTVVDYPEETSEDSEDGYDEY